MSRPFAAVPAVRLNAAALNLRVKIVAGLAGTSMLVGVFGAVAWAKFTPSIPPTPPPVPPGVGLAQTAVYDFLAGRATQVPAAAGVETRFASRGKGPGLSIQSISLARSIPPCRIGQAPERTSTGEVTCNQPYFAGAEAQNYETDIFYVTTAPVPLTLENRDKKLPGNSFHVRVNVLITADGPLLASQPAVEPALGAPAEKPVGLDYTKYNNGAVRKDPSDLPAAVAGRVSEWATLYAAAGPSNPEADQKLREIAGRKSDPAGTLKGLDGQFVVANPERDVIVVSGLPVGDVLGVRVRVVLTSTRTSEFAVSNEYDVLIPDPGSQIPTVAAWGPAGSLNRLLAAGPSN